MALQIAETLIDRIYEASVMTTSDVAPEAQKETLHDREFDHR